METETEEKPKKEPKTVKRIKGTTRTNTKGYKTRKAEKQAMTRMANAALKATVYSELKGMLAGGTGGTYYQEFLAEFLDMAKKDPNSRAGQLVASTIFHQDMLTMLDEEHEKELARDRDFQAYRLMKDFFKEQREVLMETNHSKNILVCCSRRAGKTDLASGAICHAAIQPESRIIYINLTFSNAIRQIWDNTIKRASLCGLVIEKSSKSEGTMEFANGSSLRIMGNTNNSEIDKLRGESKVSLVIVDEFFHQRNMNYAVLDVISPLMADRKDSTLLCMGTPPRIAKTYGEKCWSEPGWKKFHWTMFDNPYMPDPQKYLTEFCKGKGISIESPFIQREYFGKMGCYDMEALVFYGRKTYDEYTNAEVITDISIGVDYGFSDYNSIITLAYNKNTKHSWVVKEDKFNKAGVSDIVNCIKAHYEFAKTMCELNKVNWSDHIKIYCDTNEESITYDLMLKYKLPAFNCYKYQKAYAIEMLSDELRSGRMTIPKNGVLDMEMEQVLYKRDESTDAIIPEIDEEVGIHPDACMALLYASRKAFFDMDYDISFREKAPSNSDYEKTEDGTIIEVKNDDTDTFEDIGIIG